MNIKNVDWGARVKDGTDSNGSVAIDVSSGTATNNITNYSVVATTFWYMVLVHLFTYSISPRTLSSHTGA